MSLKLECHSNWNVTQIGISVELECHSNQNVTQTGISLKLESHSNWNVSQFEISLKMKCHSNWNVTQIKKSLKFAFHSNWETKLIEKVVNPKTPKSASIGRILIQFHLLFLLSCCPFLSIFVSGIPFAHIEGFSSPNTQKLPNC